VKRKRLRHISHTCERCKREATMDDPNPVTFGTEAYRVVIREDYTELWLCEDCRNLLREEI